MSDTPETPETEKNAETAGETPVEGLVDGVKRQIDDQLDKIEAVVFAKIDGLKGVAAFGKPALKSAAEGAFGIIREILNIPDDIGGDQD